MTVERLATFEQTNLTQANTYYRILSPWSVVSAHVSANYIYNILANLALSCILTLSHTSYMFSFVFTVKLCMPLAASLALSAALSPLIASLYVWLLSGSASLVLVGPVSQSSGCAASRASQPHQASAAATPTEQTMLHSTHSSPQRIFLVLIILRTERHDPLPLF